MKKLLILALDHFTDDQVFSWPMKRLGAVVEVYGGKGDPEKAIFKAVLEQQPDVVVWSGVCGGRDMPSREFLQSIVCGFRSVMICWDAGHKDWHPYLAEYAKHDTFDLVCGVDGSFDWPRRKHDLPCLCPINPEWYDGAGTDRGIALGFMGSFDGDSHRSRVLAELGNLVTVKRRTGEPGAYKDYADFMLRCRATVNVANSAGDGPMHVKARCVEAAWAGCCLFESEGSPLDEWISRECFIPYKTPEQIRQVMTLKHYPDYARSMGETLRHAMQPHHPRHFWNQVIGN